MSFHWANLASRAFQEDGYLQNGETTEQRLRGMANRAGQILGDSLFADRFYDYASRGFYSFATPVMTNFGRSGLPISCNNSKIPDSITGMMQKAAEIAAMTKHGAGTSGFFGDVRPRGSTVSSGGTADGPHHYARIYDTLVDVISQNSIRRGNMGGYLPVEHPDIMEWLNIGEEGDLVQHLKPGVTITDLWMEQMLAGDTAKQEIWMRIIEKRYETGLPYIVFHDTVQRMMPDHYKERGFVINGSNLCTEIFLPSTEDESYVCDLGSMNLVHFDEWKDTDAVEVYIFFLDAVMSEYIEKLEAEADPAMAAPLRFAKRHRALGLGSLGLHTALQDRMLAFGSYEAIAFDTLAHATIFRQAKEASKKLAWLYGEPEVMRGTGMRNATLCAIAPTKSSSFILGQVSQGVQPETANVYTKNLAKGKFTIRNPKLKEILAERGKDTPEVWADIAKWGGSVQHLMFLSKHERDVFKTFVEVSQLAIVQHASARQKHLDQGQSINFMIHPDTDPTQVHELMVEAWRSGLKSLYYQHGQNMAQEMVRDILTCSACEA